MPFDTRDLWGKAKVLVKVTIKGYSWHSPVGNRGVSDTALYAEARRNAGVRAGDVVIITLEPIPRSERS